MKIRDNWGTNSIQTLLLMHSHRSKVMCLNAPIVNFNTTFDGKGSFFYNCQSLLYHYYVFCFKAKHHLRQIGLIAYKNKCVAYWWHLYPPLSFVQTHLWTGIFFIFRNRILIRYGEKYKTFYINFKRVNYLYVTE